MPFATRGDVVPPVRTSQSQDVHVRAGGAAVAPEQDRSRIASLSSAAIYDLTCQELVDLIRAAHVPFLPADVAGRLEFQDRDVLERLAFVARQCCRRQRHPEQPEAYE